MSGTGLATDLRLTSPDEVYQALIALVQDLNDDAAPSATAALVLVLANHIGDDAVVREAIDLVADAFREASRDDGRIVVGEALRRFFAQHPDSGMPGFAA